MDESLLKENNFIMKIFDAIPSILLIVDNDVRVLHLNLAASNALGAGIKDLYKQRGGEVLHCIHATEVSGGCGRAEYCKECVIRNSVEKAMAGGAVCQQKTKMELVKKDTQEVLDMYLLVTASPFEYENKRYVLLILEDISELVQLSGIIPICSLCKKIRDDKGYWNQIELYIRDHSEAELSHGICPECAKRLYPQYYDKMFPKEDK